MYKTTFAMLLASTLGIGTAWAWGDRPVIDAGAAAAAVAAAGYTDIREVEFDDGTWEVRATGSDGRRTSVHVDPADGTILSPVPAGATHLDLPQVMQRLAQAGYADVREIERDDGFWQAEVRDTAGLRREVRVHPVSGAIVSDRIDF